LKWKVFHENVRARKTFLSNKRLLRTYLKTTPENFKERS